MRARIGSTVGARYNLVRSCRSSGRWTTLSLLFTLRQGLRRRNLYSHDLSWKQRFILRPIYLAPFALTPFTVLSHSFPLRSVSHGTGDRYVNAGYDRHFQNNVNIKVRRPWKTGRANLVARLKRFGEAKTEGMRETRRRHRLYFLLRSFS